MVGIDVSSASVKLVELSQGAGGRLSVDRCAMELLEPGWVSEGNIEDLDNVTEAVRRVVKKSGTRTKEAALALPASVVITKKIVLPDGLTEDELEAQVESEANQYIPFSMDEVSLDFCVVGPSKSSAGDIDVVLAAARKEKVKDREALVEAAGLKPVIVDIENLASRLAAERLISRLPSKGVDQVVALFEIGSHNMSMQALKNGELLYERDQVFGGSQLTQLIVRQYGFSNEEAEVKKRANDLPDDYTNTVLKPFMESTAQEVGRALQFFFTSTPFNKVDYIFIAGGGAAMVGLAEIIRDHTGFACNVVNPFDGMSIGKGVREPKLLKEAPSYLTACGLAMRRFFK